MHGSEHLQDFLIILIAAVAVVSLFRRLRASAVLGYLVAGALIGPNGLALLQDVRATAVLGQLGVVFLLFSIGLELSIERLVGLRRYVFGLGVAQVAVTTLVLWFILRGLGLDRAAALMVGSGLALSSTAVVLQILVERRELGTPHGRVAFAVLLLQDLAVVPLLTLVPPPPDGPAPCPRRRGQARLRRDRGRVPLGHDSNRRLRRAGRTAS